jgi:hypothetical protein
VFRWDPLDSGGKVFLSPGYVILFSTLTGLLMTVFIYTSNPDSELFATIYKEDGIMENLTAVVFICSSFLMVRPVISINSDRKKSYPNWLILFYSLISIGFFLIGMEEISWGQRIFGWSTPEVFQSNVQNETNLHNFIKYSYHPVLYRFPVILPIILVFGRWLEANKKWLTFSRLVLPSLSLLGLGLIIAFVAIVWQHEELLEELGAVFVLFYSFRLFKYFSVERSYQHFAVEKV